VFARARSLLTILSSSFRYLRLLRLHLREEEREREREREKERKRESERAREREEQLMRLWLPEKASARQSIKGFFGAGCTFRDIALMSRKHAELPKDFT